MYRALTQQPITIYGDGHQRRDWLHVDDHCQAIEAILTRGKPGETYNIGANNERENLHVALEICEILDRLQPAAASYQNLITHVADRQGHDWRYGINAEKIRRELGWQPETPSKKA